MVCDVKYKVVLSDDAIAQLRDIGDYISNVLGSPGAAARTIDGILDAAVSLDLTKRHRVRRKDTDGHEIRHLLYKKCKIIYFVDDKDRTVWVDGIFHTLMNISETQTDR